MKTPLRVVRLGRIGYAKANVLQIEVRERLISEGHKTPTLFLLEHDPVYTVGLRSKEYTPQLESRLRSLGGVDFERTNRGGLITFHGPGQLVAYPIISLKHFRLGMKDYISLLENTIIAACQSFNVTAETSREHTGVWIGDSKIAAIGVHGSRFVTTHGIALNCNIDLRYFDHIVPCGIEGKSVTSLTKQLNRDISVNDALKPFVECFSNLFNCEPIEDENNLKSLVR